MDSFAAQGFVASIKPPAEVDAGYDFICVDIADAIAGVQASALATITDYSKLVSGTDDVITVGATSFTAQATSVTPGGATFQAATSNNLTAASVAAQINAHATASTLVTARAMGNKVLIRAILHGTSGNSIVLTYTDNDSNVGATVTGSGHLAGGTAPDASYAAKKLQVNTLIKDFVAGGLITKGTEVSTITISNGQSFDFKFYLPNRVPILLRATMHTSENNLLALPDDETLRSAIFDQVNGRYRLGWDFEPQRYFNLSDVPWASDCLLEWSDDDGDSWNSSVYVAAFTDLFTFELGDIEVSIDP